MKKKVLVGIGVGVAVVGLSSYSAYVVHAASKHITVNNVQYDVDTLDDDFISALKKSKPVFTNDELNDYVTYTCDTNAIKSRSLGDKLSAYFSNENYSIDYSYEVDMQSLKSWVKGFNSTATETQDAKIVAGKKKYKIQEEVEGTKINFKALKESIENKEYDIDVNSFTTKPTIVSSDLEKAVKKANKYVNWSYEYSNGDKITSDISYVTLNEDNSVSLNTDWISDSVRAKLYSYNTVGKARKFKTHSGKKITVSGGTWGSYVDYDTEVANVTEAFKSGKSKTNVEPSYSYEREEIGNTYVEVSISGQHVWVYKNGKCIMDTSCVTGTRGSHDTPTGTYYIMERINGKYLTGADYKTWVNKWMRLTYSGVGFHDATWRSSFGGSIYTYSGSHGCINLPYSFASKLFDTVYVNEPVIIY